MPTKHKAAKEKVYSVLDDAFSDIFPDIDFEIEKCIPSFLIDYILDCDCFFEDIEKALKADKCFWGFLKSRMK